MFSAHDALSCASTQSIDDNLLVVHVPESLFTKYQKLNIWLGVNCDEEVENVMNAEQF